MIAAWIILGYVIGGLVSAIVTQQVSSGEYPRSRGELLFMLSFWPILSLLFVTVWFIIGVICLFDAAAPRKGEGE